MSPSLWAPEIPLQPSLSCHSPCSENNPSLALISREVHYGDTLRSAGLRVGVEGEGEEERCYCPIALIHPQNWWNLGHVFLARGWEDGSGNGCIPRNLKHGLLKVISWPQGLAPPLGQIGVSYLCFFFFYSCLTSTRLCPCS